MGQNISENMQSRSNLIENWHPKTDGSNILINKMTNEEVEKSKIRILSKDLPRQIAHFASRMNNHQAQICRLLYFHPAVPNMKIGQDDKEFRQMYLYTDIMLPLKTWNKQNVIEILKGFKKLVSIHGPFKITEGMIGENEKGEVKVWISENNVNNHPDSKYMSQEQTVANLAMIITKKNQELASYLFGCNTVKDVYEKIVKTNKQINIGNNYSYKVSEKGQLHHKKRQVFEKQPYKTQYRNVFYDKNQLLYNKQLYKNNSKKTQEQHKPMSNLSCINKIPSESFQNTKQKSAIDESSAKKNTIFEPGYDIKKDKEESLNNKSMSSFRYNAYKSIPKCEENTRNTFSGQTGNNQGFPKGEVQMNSQKGLKSNNWNYHEHQNSFGMPFKSEVNQFENKSKTPNKGQLNEIQGKKAFDITIINNNNVSNYINTIVHNHNNINKLQKKSSMHSPQHKDEDYQRTDPLHSSHKPRYKAKQYNSPNKDKERQKNNYVPNFIQQKKKNNGFVKSSSPNKVLEEEGFLTRQTTMKSENTNLSSLIQSPTLNIFLSKQNGKESKKNNTASFAPKVFERKSQKVYTFMKNNNPASNIQRFYNPTKTQGSQISKTPSPNKFFQEQSFSSFEKNYFNKPYKGQLRTKTTDFYPRTPQPFSKLPSKKQSQIESKKQSQIEKCEVTINVNKVNQTQNLIRQEDKQQDTRRSHSPQQKLQMKKQLKKQFSFLLGTDTPNRDLEVQEDQPHKLMKRSQIVQIKRSNEDVNQKIAKKQIQFAQLKKMAQELLI